MSEIDDDDLDNLLDDDPEMLYHPSEEIVSVSALQIDLKMVGIFIKDGKIDEEEGKMKLETIKSMIELAKESKKQTPDQYIDNMKDSWHTHQDWMEACKDDKNLGKDKKFHLNRIKKRIEKIEEELTSMKVDVEKLKSADDDDDAALKELDSDNEDDMPDDISEDDGKHTKEIVNRVSRMPTMEEHKNHANYRQSQVVNDFADKDVDEILSKRMNEYINAIEYLKKNNLSKDQKAIFAILERAETAKKLQKRQKKNEDVELYEIPAEVSPDDILGMSGTDRIKRFQAYTNHITKTMNELKLIGSNNFKIFNATKNATAKENYERSITLFKKQDQLKKDLVELAKNRWQPIPELQYITENFTDVKKAGEFNADVTGVNIKLTIPEDFQNNSKYFYKFKWMDDDTTLKKVKVDNKGAEQERKFEIDFGHHQKLSDLKIAVKIKQSSFLVFNKTLHIFDTNLAGFKKASSIKKNFTFEKFKFYVTTWMDMPMNEENKSLEEIKMLDVAYTAPPFKSAGAAKTKPAAKGKPAASTAKSTGGGAAPSKNVAKSGKVEIPEGIKADEIKDPDVQRNLWSVYYCQKQSDAYEKKVNGYLKNQQQIVQEDKEKMLLFKSQVIMMTQAIENEQVTQEKYMEYLNKGLAHDRILLKYFNDTGATAKAKIVQFRIE